MWVESCWIVSRNTSVFVHCCRYLHGLMVLLHAVSDYHGSQWWKEPSQIKNKNAAGLFQFHLTRFPFSGFFWKRHFVKSETWSQHFRKMGGWVFTCMMRSSLVWSTHTVLCTQLVCLLSYRTRGFVPSRSLSGQVSSVSFCLLSWWHHFLPYISALYRYEELLGWAKTSLSAQGLSAEAVDQTLHELTQKLEMEDVRRELREAEEPKSEDGVCDNTKSLGMESEVEEPEAKKRCRWGVSFID